ncbi:hypothetical protein FBULB1_7529 [Fusarium bulbicola]|nr:hypothetical protein FBULB1_7529 [Fusarium bulbicola]
MPSLTDRKPAASPPRTKPIQDRKSSEQKRIEKAITQAIARFPGAYTKWSEEDQLLKILTPDHTGEDRVVQALYSPNYKPLSIPMSYKDTTIGIEDKNILQLVLASEPQAEVATNEASAVGLVAEKEK